MLTLILGGARSGKSRYAQKLLGERPCIYVATARPTPDREMTARIEQHRRDRPSTWLTIEEPEAVPHIVSTALPLDAPILIECITLWIANLFERESRTPERRQQEILIAAVRELADAARTREVIAVSNEVGSGIVPATQSGRRFRDLQGWTNQALAAAADSVTLVVAGVPLVLKSRLTPL